MLQIDDLDREKDTDGTVYFRGAVRSELTDRDYAIALGCIGGAGNPAAAAAAASAIATYRPHVVLLMGIAAGLRDKVRIDEVVLSDRVVAYEPAALVRTASGAKEQPRPEIDRAPHTILQDVVSYRPDPSRLRTAFDRAGGIVPTSPAGCEDEFRAHVASTITTRLGTIASGEKLLRDPAKLVAVREQHGKTEVGEMEAAGLVDACRRGSVPWLVIRGISDFGDELKNDRFMHSRPVPRRRCCTISWRTGSRWLRRHLPAPALVPPPPASRRHTTRSCSGARSTRDEEFVGRDEERRWLREAIDKRQPVQLLGERLMGKTSLLRRVERNEFRSNYRDGIDVRLAGRRRPVPRRQGEHAGRVLPHVRRAARETQADRADRGPHAARDLGIADRLRTAVRLGPARRHRAARVRGPDRDPAQEAHERSPYPTMSPRRRASGRG